MFQQALSLPVLIDGILRKKAEIDEWAEDFTDLDNAIFIGRGTLFPIALEGALKLKEISYIHADAYPAGELKHGPIALIDHELPTIAIASKDGFEGKIKSNIQEILARKGRIIIVASKTNKKIKDYSKEIIYIPRLDEIFAPLLTILPLQLFAYYLACFKGHDVDKPRNLAKSVTVE